MVLPEREDPECAANRRRDEPRCRYAAREGTALPCRMSPTFLLSCQKKSRRHSGGKGNRLGMSWPPMGQLTQNGGLAVTNCRPNPEVSYRLRYTYSARNCVPAPESPPHTNVPNRTPPALLSAAAPPSNSGRGFQRGGATAPPLCARGGMGDGGVPPCFGWGSKGEGPLR